jgi:hypothetical protein
MTIEVVYVILMNSICHEFEEHVKKIIKVNIIDYFLINKRKRLKDSTTLGNQEIMSII